MTLKEAYEQMRKEVLALRRENAKLKNGTYVDADRQANEKEIRRLTRELAKALKEKERYKSLYKEYRFWGSDDSRSEILRLTKLLEEANETIKKLKAQMNRDHENSSIPSSQKPFHKKIKNSRVKTDRKPGAQKGHPGHKRPHMEPTAPVIVLPPSQVILSNGDFYPTGKFISKQVADIDIHLSVTEYSAQIYRNRVTGERYHAPFPEGVSNEFNYGKNVKALAFLLNNYCNVSIDKTQELLQGITNDKLILSKGLINSLSKQFSHATANDRKKIYDMLLLAPSMHTDFTPGRVNGKTVQVLICTNPYETLYCFSEHKGHQGISGTPVEEYLQTLVHDHDITFYNYGSDHQECLAHVLRYLQNAIENEPDLTWHKDMKTLISGCIHDAKQNRNFSDKRIQEIEDEYDKILRTADSEYGLHPPGKYFMDGFNLFLRMKEYKKNHLLFLNHPELEYTNNLAERGLRKFKRKFKQSVTFRSNESVAFLCDCMSILETKRQQGANLFDTAKLAFIC